MARSWLSPFSLGRLLCFYCRACAVCDPSRALRSFATQFASVPAAGPVNIEVSVERTGKSMTTTSARLLQAGSRASAADLAEAAARWRPSQRPSWRCPPHAFPSLDAVDFGLCGVSAIDTCPDF